MTTNIWGIYNLEIKEADPGYTIVSTIDFNHLKHNKSIAVSVQYIYLVALYYLTDIKIFS